MRNVRRCWRCRVDARVAPVHRCRWAIMLEGGRVQAEFRLCWSCARWYDNLVRAEKVRVARELDALFYATVPS